MSDEHFYKQAAEELGSGKVNPGLMAKAYAKGEGDENRSRAAYIELRVVQLKEEAAVKKANEIVRKSSKAFKVVMIAILIAVAAVIGLSLGDLISPSKEKTLPMVVSAFKASTPLAVVAPTPVPAPTFSNPSTLEQEAQLMILDYKLNIRQDEVRAKVKAWGEKLTKQRPLAKTPEQIAAYNQEQMAYARVLEEINR